jgi:hypothetical protein
MEPGCRDSHGPHPGTADGAASVQTPSRAKHGPRGRFALCEGAAKTTGDIENQKGVIIYRSESCT